MIKTSSFFAFLLIACSVTPLFAGETEDLLEQARRGDKNTIELYYSSLAGGKLDFSQAWKSGPKTLEMAWATLQLDGGWMIPVVPKELKEGSDPEGLVPERPISGVVYVGEGKFAYTAPHETERWLMNYSLHEINKKYTDLDGLDVKLEGGAVLLFQGKWLAQLREGAPKINSEVAKNVAEVVKRDGAGRQCYQEELTKNPKLSGKITLKFVIAENGSVSSAITESSTMKNLIVEKCLNERVLRMTFPPTKVGITYTFVFNTVDKKIKKVAEKLWRKRGDLFKGGIAHAQTWDEFAGLTEDSITLDMPTKSIKGVSHLTFSDDRGEKESMSLGVYKRYALNRDSILSWSLGSWFPPDVAEGKTDYQLGYARVDKGAVDIQHYDMDLTVYRDDDEGQWGMNVDGTMEIEVRDESVTALKLSMMNYGENEFDPNSNPDVTKLSGSNKVNVRKVELDGERLKFLHKQHQLIVQLPREYKKGEKITLGFSYGGLFIMTIKQPAPQTELSMSSSIGAVGSIINWRVPNDYPWYPQAASHSDSFTFDWNLKVPKPMVAATSGTLVSMTEEGDYNVHEIKERTPVTFPAILFGRLSIIENDPDYDAGEYKIRLYVHPGFEKGAQSFIDEAAAVIRFYEARFGKYPFMELDIAQMPIGTGYAQAPAGLVQMDGYTYISKTDLVNIYGASDGGLLDIRDNFVPHEIAHEWWGHKAGWGSSRDQWVSETFAEYSAALFIEERERQKSGEEGDISGYEDRKDRWGAIGRRGHTFKRTGPLWIGNRVGDRRTSSIYARGPLVLDMLRQNLGKEVVLKMMYLWCELAAKNEGRVVTEDLELILKKIVPSFDFGEFMRLYVKGNEPLPDDPKKSKAGELGQSKF